AWADSKAIWALGSIAALLTAFYMTRQVIMVFFGEPRWHDPLPVAAATAAGGNPDADVEPESEDAAEAEVAEHVEHHLPDDFRPHESPWQMTLPLVVLAGAALLGGGLNLPFTPDLHVLDHWLEPSLFGAASHPDFSTGEKVF